jgi:hypothetical protein
VAQTKNSTVIRSNKLFTGIYDINFNFREKNYLEVKEGDVIYSRGDRSDYVYLLISGRIKLKTYENPRQPKVYLISKNEFFGEKELLEKTTRHSSALAEKDTTLFIINQKDFMKLVSSNRKIMENLKEKKYEEVVAPTRKKEFKEDIFKRIINEPVTKKNGIELRDYSYENPLLELKAKDEITEAIKMYEENEEDIINFDETDVIPGEDNVKWETEEDGDEEETNAAEEGIEEIPAEEIPGNIADEFPEVIERVETQSELPEIGNTSVYSDPDETLTNERFIAVVEKLKAGSNKTETDRLIVEACSELINAERGVLFYPDSNNVLKGKLYDEDTELIAGSETIPGKCLREARLINIKDIFNDPNFNPSVDYVSYFHIHSLICLPVTSGGKVKAVLQLFNSFNEEFSDSDEETLSSISPVILKAIEKWEQYPEEKKISDIADEEERKAESLREHEKQISLKVLMEFLLQEFQIIIGDVKQFNTYLQRIDIPGEAKEISDIVTNQTIKIIDLLEALKSYSEVRKNLKSDKLSYIAVFEEMVNLLAEYTEGRKVNLYKRLETDAYIMVDPKFLYLSVFQLIKYQCDLMPFGGNIFISSVKTDEIIEINIRNATKKTDESLVISPAINYNENTPRGIGLSLARRIIEDHDAQIEIKSQSGTGLEISIRFPLADNEK